MKPHLLRRRSRWPLIRDPSTLFLVLGDETSIKSEWWSYIGKTSETRHEIYKLLQREEMEQFYRVSEYTHDP